MSTYLINPEGRPLYRGHPSNPKAARLLGAGWSVAPFEPPEPAADHRWKDGTWVQDPRPGPPVPTAVPPAGLINAMAAAEWISEAEADAWIARRGLPAVVETVLDEVPAAERPAIRRRLLGMREAERSDPLVAAVAAALGAGDGAVDALFRSAAG